MKTQQRHKLVTASSSRHHKTNSRNHNRKSEAMQLMVIPRKPFRRVRRTPRRQIHNRAQPIYIRNHARQRHHRPLFPLQRRRAIRQRPPRQKMRHRIHRRARFYLTRACGTAVPGRVLTKPSQDCRKTRNRPPAQQEGGISGAVPRKSGLLLCSKNKTPASISQSGRKMIRLIREVSSSFRPLLPSPAFLSFPSS